MPFLCSPSKGADRKCTGGAYHTNSRAVIGPPSFFERNRVMESFVIGFLITLSISITAILAVGGVWALAKVDLIFTSVREGTGKNMVSGVGDDRQHVGFIMRYQGMMFRKAQDSSLAGDDRYDVISDPNPGDDDLKKYTDIIQPHWFQQLKQVPLLGNFFEGIWYIGLPPRGVRDYKFKWTSVEQRETGVSDEGDAQNILVPNEKRIDYVYLVEDMYGMVVSKADLKDLMEHDIRITFRAQVVNPYKAMWRVEKWLEAIINRLSAAFPAYVATLSTKELNSLKNGKVDLDQIFKKLVSSFKRDYGVKVHDIGILNTDPSEEIAEQYRAAQLAVVTAESLAKAKVINAKAEATAIRTVAKAEQDRVRQVYGAIEEHRDGADIRRSEAMEDTNLSTLATGGVALALPTDQPNNGRGDNRSRRGRNQSGGQQ